MILQIQFLLQIQNIEMYRMYFLEEGVFIYASLARLFHFHAIYFNFSLTDIGHKHHFLTQQQHAQTAWHIIYYYASAY